MEASDCGQQEIKRDEHCKSEEVRIARSFLRRQTMMLEQKTPEGINPSHAFLVLELTGATVLHEAQF